MVDWWSFGILLYELMYGYTPFRGARRDATFDNVLKMPLQFPATPAISPAAKDLISRLLHKVGGWGSSGLWVLVFVVGVCVGGY